MCIQQDNLGLMIIHTTSDKCKGNEKDNVTLVREKNM